MLGQEALTHKYRLKHQAFKAISSLSSIQPFFPSLSAHNMHKIGTNSMLKILHFLLSFKCLKVTRYLIFYSELRLIFVYLESDSWCLTAWVSPGLFLGQAWVYLAERRRGVSQPQPACREEERERGLNQDRERERER